MFEMLALSMSNKIITAIIALIALRLTLKMFDRMSGLNFKGWIAKAETKDVAIYTGMRFIGACILFAYILG